MTTNNPKVQAILITCKDKNGETVLMRAVRLLENHDPSCVNDNWNYDPLIRFSDHEAAIDELQAENQRLRKALTRHVCTDMTDALRTAELEQYLSDGIAADKARIEELERDRSACWAEFKALVRTSNENEDQLSERIAELEEALTEMRDWYQERTGLPACRANAALNKEPSQ